MAMTCGLLSITQLANHEIAKMLKLMEEYYDHINPNKFIRDLEEKDGVLVIYDHNQEICGFTTYLLMETIFKGEKIKILYSGDTVIRQQYWGQLKTAKMFMAVIKDCLARSSGPLYWFLLSKGIRTYRLLPLYFNKYYPAPHFVIPSREQELLACLAQLKFGPSFNRQTGVIKHSPPADRLKKEFLSIADHKLDDPLVKFFLEHNPGYRTGDDLCCLAEVTVDNLTEIGQRWLNLDLQPQ